MSLLLAVVFVVMLCPERKTASFISLLLPWFQSFNEWMASKNYTNLTTDIILQRNVWINLSQSDLLPVGGSFSWLCALCECIVGIDALCRTDVFFLKDFDKWRYSLVYLYANFTAFNAMAIWFIIQCRSNLCCLFHDQLYIRFESMIVLNQEKLYVKAFCSNYLIIIALWDLK